MHVLAGGLVPTACLFSSLLKHPGFALEQMQNWQIESYSLPSWTLEDSMQACKDEEFYASVLKALVCPNPQRAKTFSVEATPQHQEGEKRRKDALQRGLDQQQVLLCW